MLPDGSYLQPGGVEPLGQQRQCRHRRPPGAGIAAERQRAFEVVPYIPTGQWKPVTAYHKNLKGVIQAPPYLMWNVEKT